MSKKVIILLLLVILIIGILITAGCIEKKERITWDERGLGKDTYYEPSGTPGFESISIIMAISLFLFFKRRKKKVF